MPPLALPDPRLSRSYPSHALLAGLQLENGSLASQSRQVLRDTLERMLIEGDDAGVRTLLSWPSPPPLRRALSGCLQSVIDGPTDADLRLHMFFIPIVMVAGSQSSAELPMVLGQVSRLHGVLREAGSLGPSEQFTLSGALCDEAALEGLSRSAMFRAARVQAAAATPMDLPPAPLSLEAGQSVHLRFLPGSELLPRGAPGVRETAGEPGRWGRAFTHELAQQLAAPGITLLPLGRAPMGLHTALSAGRYCREEMAFQLDLGEQLRAFRSRTGDPSARLFAEADSALVVELRSPWEADPVRCRWHLYAEDDFDSVHEAILALLHDCRVEDLHIGGADPGRPAQQ